MCTKAVIAPKKKKQKQTTNQISIFMMKKKAYRAFFAILYWTCWFSLLHTHTVKKAFDTYQFYIAFRK